MAEDLLIKINADAKNAEKAFDDIRAKTEDLEGQISTVAKISAVGFAALTAELGLSIHAFAEAQAASNQLTQALQTQGIAAEQVAVQTAAGVTEVVGITEAYKLYAEQVQELTGIDDDAIVKSQAVAQSFLGQTKITKELTQAIADLSVKEGISLDEAATKIGRTIGTTTNAFARQGLKLSETATQAERFAQVLEFVNGKVGGAAEAANKGLGSIKGLATAFGNLQEAIGARFAPAAETVIIFFTRLFNFASKNKFITDIAAAFITAGIAVTGLGVALPILAQAFLTVRAAMLAFGLSANIALLGIPLLIGALIGAVTFLALNWEKSLGIMKAALSGFAKFAQEALGGIALLLIGAFDFDIGKVKAGLAKLGDAFKEGAQAAAKELPQATEKAVTEQNLALQKAAEKRRAQEAEEAEKRKNLRTAENDLVRLELTNQSAALIELKKKEIAVLKELQTNQNADQIELLQARYEQLVALEADQRTQDQERHAAFAEEDLAAQAELDQLGIDQKAVLRAQDTAELESKLLTDKEIERKVATDILSERIKNRNLELEDRKKYNVVVSTLNSILRTDEVQAAKSLGNELAVLATSKNNTLKSIGKAFAISNIIINTADASAQIFTDVNRIIKNPFIAIPIASALVAARVAFGAEQIGNVVAAQEGALVEGGIPGKDSVPFLLEPGELVAPKKNFDEVVGAVQAGRSGAQDEMAASLKSIDEKLQQPHQTVIQGDVLADSTFIDILIDKLNDRIRFGNAVLASNAT